MQRTSRAAWAVLALLGTGPLLAGCAGAPSPASSAAGLERYPEAQNQIVAYYASQGAGEPAFNCGRGRIEHIDGSRVVIDTPVEVVLEVTYRFQATGVGAANLPCDGSATRWFTFDRERDGRLNLAEMADTAP